MITPEELKTLEEIKADYLAAKARGAGVAQSKERLKNALFNNFDKLIDCAVENAELKEEVDALEAALREAAEERKSKKKPQGGT